MKLLSHRRKLVPTAGYDPETHEPFVGVAYAHIKPGKLTSKAYMVRFAPFPKFEVLDRSLELEYTPATH